MKTKEFANEPIAQESLPADPFVLFGAWYALAAESEPWAGAAMVLATVDDGGLPSSRVVLLRGVDSGGFRFYTNYESRKGRDLAGNPACALVFWWPSQVRQVRVEGVAQPLPADVSDAYFASRPRESRVSAWVSAQSAEIGSRQELEDTVNQVTAAFDGREVPRPSHWGGYAVVPHRIEFWQGGRARLHDRFCYRRQDAARAWVLTRLAP